MSPDTYQNLSLDKIDIPEARSRALNEEWCRGLAGMIKERGLYHPILVRRTGDRYQLVSGLHRLAAFRLMECEDIPCRVSDGLTDDEARMDEVMENLGRQELVALDRCHHLYELKQVWERKYPHTVHGYNSPKSPEEGEWQSLPLSPEPQEIFGFARANAEKIGLSQRTIRNAVQIWEGLSIESRARLAGTPMAGKQTELKALSRLNNKYQMEVLDLVLGKEEVKNVAGALQALDGGVVPNAEEKQLLAFRKHFSELPDTVFDRVILDNEERVLAALRRQGRRG